MNPVRRNPRLVIMMAVAALVLLALIVATGGGVPSFSSTSDNGNAATTPQAAGPPAVGQGKQVAGDVSAMATHLDGHTWRFAYTVRNTGSVPISGFQLNAGRANLYNIVSRPGWTYYGSGVCHSQVSGVLIYWSTGLAGAGPIPPGGRGRFGFTVNTGGTVSRLYSLSYGAATPIFRNTTMPAPSSLPGSGACKG